MSDDDTDGLDGDAIGSVLILGVGIAAVIGYLVDDVGTWIGIGLLISVIAGAAISRRK